MSKVSDIVLERLVNNIVTHSCADAFWTKGFKSSVINWYTGKQYSGANRLFLQFGSGEYLTMNQLSEYNKKNGTTFKVVKGSVANMVVYYTRTEKEVTQEEVDKDKVVEAHTHRDEDTGKLIYVRTVLRYYDVFDIDDIADDAGNHPKHRIGTDFKIVDSNADKVICDYLNASGVHICVSPAIRCCSYNNVGDIVRIPRDSAWVKPVLKYQNLFHELVHSTGVGQRLNRIEYSKYHSSDRYRAIEELVAESGSAMLCSECGLDVDMLNFDAYLLNWAKVLQRKDTARKVRVNWDDANKLKLPQIKEQGLDEVTSSDILHAFSAAEKAYQYILGVTLDTTE